MLNSVTLNCKHPQMGPLRSALKEAGKMVYNAADDSAEFKLSTFNVRVCPQPGDLSHAEINLQIRCRGMVLTLCAGAWGRSQPTGISITIQPTHTSAFVHLRFG